NGCRNRKLESMLSDKLESKPELLVQFVQNTSIPLGPGLVESEPKDITCLSSFLLLRPHSATD
ncbi:hypothetical protein KIL84_018539, partial [Mauremys mutica]